MDEVMDMEVAVAPDSAAESESGGSRIASNGTACRDIPFAGPDSDEMAFHDAPTEKSESDGLARIAIAPDDVDPLFVQRVPIAFARRFRVLGLRAVNGNMPDAGDMPDAGVMPLTGNMPVAATMSVAVVSADDLHALDKITVLLGRPCRPLFVEESVLLQAVNDAYRLQETPVDAVIADLGAEDVTTLLAAASADLLDSGGASPVTRMVNLILLEAVKRRASDVHVQPYADRLQVRLRIDGVLYDYVRPPQHLREELVSRIKVMGRMNIAEKRVAQDGRTTVQVGDKTIDLRIASLPTSYGERVVLRLLDKSARLYRLAELGMDESDMIGFRRLIRQPHGIVLVTGPTGSGKSTTLYAALQELDCAELNVLTLEDPIEYQLPGVSQTQVSDKKGMTFATGLRHVLRQDPDVIMVGEIRDQETARMAIQSSLTGHLVFSTLHTNDAVGAVARLLDLGVEPYLVAGSLLGVLAQRLVRRVCGKCRAPRALCEQDRTLLSVTENTSERVVFEAVGCAACHQTGYHDRVGIFELLLIDDALREGIAAGARSLTLKQIAQGKGMTTLRDDALRKLWEGETTAAEVQRVTHAESEKENGECGMRNGEYRMKNDK